MADAAENFDDMTEDQLAEARGDNYDPDKAGEAQAEPEGSEAPEDQAAGESGGEGEAATDQDADTGDEQEGDDAPARPIMMPKTRYDAMKGRMQQELDAMRQELETLRKGGDRQAQPQQQAAEPQPSLDDRLAELDTKIAQAMADGDHEAAAKAMHQARLLERQQFQSELKDTSTSTRTEAQRAMEYDMFIEKVETVRPELNPDSESYDEAVSTEVVDLMQAFMSRGSSPKQSLEKALNYVYPQGWDKAEESVPAAPAAEKPSPRRTDVQRNVDTAKAQAPRPTAGSTSDSAGMGEEIDVMALSDEEFDKLTEEQLARMRGDDG